MATHADSSAADHDPLHNVGAPNAVVPHVVVVPLPTEGHLNPFLSLARFLASSGHLSLTLVQPTHSLATAHSLHAASANFSDHTNLPAPFRIEVIPGGFDRSKPFSFSTFISDLHLMHKHVTDLLHRLMLEDNAPVCLLIDSFVPWASALAAEFRLSLVLLYTSAASSFCLGVHIPDLAARGFIPATAEGAKDKIVDFIPGLSPFRVADMPRNLTSEEGLQNDGCRFFTSIYQQAKSADRVLVNTIYELEGCAVDALRAEDHLDIVPVGPLFMISMPAPASQLLNGGEDELISWLDQQQEFSVLYIAFGSVVTIQEEVLAELAHGLEASGQRFVWVIRPDAYRGKGSVEGVLPKGFMERTRGRGRVIAWAPQLTVLSHRSVGAFLTHCGWNSVLESLSNGVPMLGFPQMADQNTNFKLMVYDWKVGLPLIKSISSAQHDRGQLHHAGTDGKVERSGVQSAIMAMMTGGEGTQVRMRAREWKEVVRKASEDEEGGSSKHHLQKLVHDLKHGLLSKPKLS